MKRNILVVAAHPDDEVLGMGGTIARHTNLGDEVHVFFLSDGVSSREGSNEQNVKIRRECACAAMEILGGQIAGFGNFPDNQFDSVSLLSIVQAIEAVKKRIEPEVVYTHHGGDLNVDHRKTCQSVLSAFRPQPQEACVEILTFEVLSATEWASPRISAPFLPETYIDVSAYLSKLEQAYRCYSQELRPDPHARSVKALLLGVQKRGREVGLVGAEAFMTLRRIIK
jgi:LmbE family N-acetylglucosaminyl deacetylase